MADLVRPSWMPPGASSSRAGPGPGALMATGTGFASVDWDEGSDRAVRLGAARRKEFKRGPVADVYADIIDGQVAWWCGANRARCRALVIVASPGSVRPTASRFVCAGADPGMTASLGHLAPPSAPHFGVRCLEIRTP